MSILHCDFSVKINDPRIFLFGVFGGEYEQRRKRRMIFEEGILFCFLKKENNFFCEEEG